MHYTLSVMKCVKFCWYWANKGPGTKKSFSGFETPCFAYCGLQSSPCVCPPFYSSSQQSKCILRPVLCTKQLGPLFVHLLLLKQKGHGTRFWFPWQPRPRDSQHTHQVHRAFMRQNRTRES